MSPNGSSDDLENERKKRPHQPRTEDEDDLRRGNILMGVFIFIFISLSVIYIVAHYKWKEGPFSPKIVALNVVSEATTALASAGQDILEPGVISALNSASDKLNLLEPQLSVSDVYSTTLTQINTELSGTEAHRAVLNPLFTRLGNLIQVSASSYFWAGDQDHWLEMVFWAIVGTLIFLLSELKKYSSQPYKNKREFIKFTPWYIINLFRGPFIALVILIAFLSLSFDAIGISIDLKSAPIEVLIVTAAILGYYSRVADKELDIIAEKLLGAAWKEAHPKEKNNPNHPGGGGSAPIPPDT
jgi:hypothetical protein